MTFQHERISLDIQSVKAKKEMDRKPLRVCLSMVSSRKVWDSIAACWGRGWERGSWRVERVSLNGKALKGFFLRFQFSTTQRRCNVIHVMPHQLRYPGSNNIKSDIEQHNDKVWIELIANQNRGKGKRKRRGMSPTTLKKKRQNCVWVKAQIHSTIKLRVFSTDIAFKASWKNVTKCIEKAFHLSK